LVPGPAPVGFGVMRGRRDRLLSVKEAAEELGLCTATLYGLCAEGALPHIRILNTIRIAPRDLQAFIAARRTPGAQPAETAPRVAADSSPVTDRGGRR